MKETLHNEPNMKTNAKRTKIVVCIRNNNIRVRIRQQNNQEIEHVKEFACLGSIICEDGRSKMEIIKRICKTKIAFNRNRGLLTS